MCFREIYNYIFYLINQFKHKVWGCAYRINEFEKGSNLDEREKRYSKRHYIPFYDNHDNIVSASSLVFLGTEDPKLMLGEDSLLNMAKQISSAIGPSGSNTEYLIKLADFLESTVAKKNENDYEIIKLAEKVKEILEY